MLFLLKLAHTVVWALFAGCIVGVFPAVYFGQLNVAWILIGIVMGEVVVLALNRMRCPLTDIAARYTTDRADNFDIFLPLWLARYNKHIFGGLYVLALLYAAWAWWLGAGQT